MATAEPPSFKRAESDTQVHWWIEGGIAFFENVPATEILGSLWQLEMLLVTWVYMSLTWRWRKGQLCNVVECNMSMVITILKTAFRR